MLEAFVLAGAVIAGAAVAEYLFWKRREDAQRALDECPRCGTFVEVSITDLTSGLTDLAPCGHTVLGWPR